MRPEATYDPAVETVEPRADLGLAVGIAPAANDRIQRRDEALDTLGNLPLGTLADLFLEMIEGLPSRIGVETTGLPRTAYPVGRQAQGPCSTILKPRNSNPCRTCTIRVFSSWRVTPNFTKIPVAAFNAAWASDRL